MAGVGVVGIGAAGGVGGGLGPATTRKVGIAVAGTGGVHLPPKASESGEEIPKDVRHHALALYVCHGLLGGQAPRTHHHSTHCASCTMCTTPAMHE